MAEDLKICRCCRKKDIDKAKPDTYIMPSNGWYYHIDCYNSWIAKKNDITATAEDDTWKDLLWDYLKRDVRMPKMNFSKIDMQWHHFLYKNKKRMTAKGLYFAAKYFYDVKKGKVEDAEGGIGILPYIYDESCQYWADREIKNRELYRKLEEQITLKEERKVEIKPQRAEIKKEKPMVSLADIGDMEDEND